LRALRGPAAAQTDVCYFGSVQAEVRRLQQLLKEGGQKAQENSASADDSAARDETESLRGRLAEALAACDKTKQQSKDYILKAKAASERVKAELEEQIRDLKSQLSSASFGRGEQAEQGSGQADETNTVEALKREVEALQCASQQKDAALDSMREKVSEFC